MISVPFNLRCEYLEDPIELDTPNPRISWCLHHNERSQKQSAYQIIVASDEKLALKSRGDLWDTGKVQSDIFINVPYNGSALQSHKTYYWRVRWWDKNDIVSEYSEIAKFGTAFLDENEWKAEWITRYAFTDKKQQKKFIYRSSFGVFLGKIKEFFGVYLRKEFYLDKKVQMAKAYICGLGHYELRLNGNRIGNKILDPAWTDYKKLVLYSTYDITNSLQSKNAIGIILGNGRHIQNYGFDYPKLIIQIMIQYEDSTNDIVCSDDTWKVSQGPIQENGIYLGEKYDARLEMPGWDQPNFNDSTWENVVIVNGPKLASQLIQPIRITNIIHPKKLYSTSPGIYVYDFGQNFTGFIRLEVRGQKGIEIKIRYSEIINDDGNINTATNREAVATEIYILKGVGKEVFEPHFTYHGFRYVEISGFPGVPTLDTIEGNFIHTDLRNISQFFCSNDLINKIHENIIWGQLSNFMSIPTDCPQRDERHGWMGDAQLTVEEAIFNFDAARFYIKYLNDIKICQDENGAISDIVPPYWRLYPADPAWGTAYITIAWYLYWYYYDIKILEDHYESMKKYVEHLQKNTENNILYKFGKYGDWCPPGNIVSRKTPIELVCTWYYYHDTLILSKIAHILGKDQNSTELLKRSEEIKKVFNEKFLKEAYDIPRHSLADRTVSQTSNILPLYLDMVPDKKKGRVLSTLLNCIIEDHDYHLDTGIVGTRYLWDVLTENGYADVAYKIITQKSYPGYGYMIKEGATTLWERWEKLEGKGMNSHNHIMLGSVDTWFFKALIGINSIEPGWSKIKIKPFIPSDVEYSGASLNTIKGVVYCSWEKHCDSLKLIIEIPIGCIAEIWIPIENMESNISGGEKLLWKNGEIIEKVKEIVYNTMNEKFIIFNIGSGYYQFKVQSIKKN